MTAASAWLTRHASGPLDPRLRDAATPARRLVVVAVIGGVAQSATILVQAVLLATVIQRCLQRGASLGAVTPQLAGLGAAMAARGALAWVLEWAAQRAAAVVTIRLRRDLLSAVLGLGPAWVGGERTGELALTATAGVDAVGTYLGRYLPQLVLAVLAPIAVLSWVAYTDWVSLLILVALVALIPPAMVFFGRRAAEATSRQWRGLASLSAQFLELIQGLPTLRAFGRVEFGRRSVVEATEGLRRSTLRTLRVAFLSSLSLELLAGLGTGLVAMVLGLRLLSGHTSLYVALAVLLVSPEVFLPLRRAAAEFHASAEGNTAAVRIAGILDRAAPARLVEGAHLPPGPGPQRLSLESVGVAFDGRGSPALCDLTLRVEPGQRIAIVGPSGSGKSTALHAVLGLVPLSSGRVRFGSVDLAAVDADSWRRRVAWVPQRPHLFSGSIGDNLRLGDPDASEEAIAAAIATAGLDHFIDRLPGGLDTMVGERGTTVSSGERHRLAIARAVLHGGDVVLLDEVGSHLDPTDRDRLSGALEEWLLDKTVIVAAHHPEMVRGIDEVIVLDAGVMARPAGPAR